jgi:hypothetical protein
MPDPSWRPGEQHPEEWRQDLNPNAMAGQNIGLAGPHPETDAPTAFDLKDAHRLLADLTDDDLKQIPILPPGSRLEQGATYLDLRDPRHREFTARGDMEAGPSDWYVPKDQVDYQLWNRLIGVTNPERLGEADDT